MKTAGACVRAPPICILRFLFFFYDFNWHSVIASSQFSMCHIPLELMATRTSERDKKNSTTETKSNELIDRFGASAMNGIQLNWIESMPKYSTKVNGLLTKGVRISTIDCLTGFFFSAFFKRSSWLMHCSIRDSFIWTNYEVYSIAFGARLKSIPSSPSNINSSQFPTNSPSPRLSSSADEFSRWWRCCCCEQNKSLIEPIAFGRKS